MVRGYMTAESVMEISDEIVTILFIKRHESSSHDDEFYFVNIMSNFLELLYSVSGLNIWVVSGSDGSHGSRLITCV
jgi:hypothetical protein